MTPAHRRESYGRAAEACKALRLKVTKRRYTNVRTGDPDCKWVVHFEHEDPRRLLCARHFPSLEHVIRWCAGRNGVAPTPAELVSSQPQPQPIEEPVRTLPLPLPMPAQSPAHNPTPIPDEPDPPRIHAEPVSRPFAGFTKKDGPSLDDALRAILAGHKPGLDESAVRALISSELDKRPAGREILEIRRPDLPVKEVSTKGEHALFAEAVRALSLGLNVFACGPSGSGKTTMLEHAATASGLELFIVPPPSDPFEVYGFRDASGNYQDTPVWRALNCGKPALLLFDEIDRSDARALTSAHTILAGNGIASFPHAQLPIPETLRIAATGNTWGVGPDADFVGANKLDLATLNRFPIRLFVDYDQDLERALAIGKHGATPELVATCQSIRAALKRHGIRLAWTPRDTFALARMVGAGKSLPDALSLSCLATLKPDQRAKVTP